VCVLSLFLAFALATPVERSPTPVKLPVQRLVSLSPAVTEIVCALGAENRLVGVTRFDDYPDSVKRLPKVGGFIDPSFEATLSLKPDIVVMNKNGSNQGFSQALAKAKIPWLALPDETLADFSIATETLGQVLGLNDAATHLIAQFSATLKALAEHPATGSALLVFGHRPLIVAGADTFGGELLACAGLKNAYRGNQRFPTIDFETLLALAPTFIIDVDMLAGGEPDRAFYTPLLSALEKQKTKLIFSPDARLLRLGPRLPLAMAELMERLRP
jgi:iron complex transport system substrate-binding protein